MPYTLSPHDENAPHGSRGKPLGASVEEAGALARAAGAMLARRRMEGIAAEGLPFAITGAATPGLMVRCLDGLAAGGDLLAFCNGIGIGRLPLPPEVPAGTSLLLPILRLPLVPLPAVIRLAASVGGADLSPPWMLLSADVARALLGPTPVAIEDLRLDQGMLRGVLRDRVNGLLRPLLVARINEASNRMAMVEAPVALPEGGCACRFALPLGPADLNGEGLSVTLLLLGQEAPLARFDWTRADLAAAAPRLAALEGRIRQLEQQAAAAEAAARRELIGAPSPAAIPGAAPTAPAVLVQDRVDIPLCSPHFGFGWHDAEQDQAGRFRWMAGQGVVTNPAPHRPVAGVTLTIPHVYGATTPVLRAAFDGQPCEVAVRDDSPVGFVATIRPAGSLACLALHLESPHAGSPAGDGASGDARTLSVAVAALVFDYAG